MCKRTNLTDSKIFWNKNLDDDLFAYLQYIMALSLHEKKKPLDRDITICALLKHITYCKVKV